MTPVTPTEVRPSGADARASIAHAEGVMGTVVSFRVIPGPGVDAASAAGLLTEACRRLHEADRLFSTWKEESELSRLRRGELRMEDAPLEIAEVFARCQTAKRLSDGWFDPWAMPGGVDPTGLVKGWAIEKAIGVLRDGGVEAALVNGAGDIAVYATPGTAGCWRVGVRHPWRSDALACIVSVPGTRAVATSGCYERGRHLIDPHTGAPSAAVASATVHGPSLSLCDAFATGLAVGGEEVLQVITELPGYEGYIIGHDGAESWTHEMPFLD